MLQATFEVAVELEVRARTHRNNCPAFDMACR